MQPDTSQTREPVILSNWAGGLLLVVVLSAGLGLPKEAVAAMASSPAVRAELRAVTGVVVRVMRSVGQEHVPAITRPSVADRGFGRDLAAKHGSRPATPARPVPPMYRLIDLPPPLA